MRMHFVFILLCDIAMHQIQCIYFQHTCALVLPPFPSIWLNYIGASSIFYHLASKYLSGRQKLNILLIWIFPHGLTKNASKQKNPILICMAKRSFTSMNIKIVFYLLWYKSSASASLQNDNNNSQRRIYFFLSRLIFKSLGN